MRADRPGQSALLLLDVIAALEIEHADYLVIGAFALAVHGTIRASAGVDALLNASDRKLASLRSRLERLGFRTTLRRGDEHDPVQTMLAVNDAHGNQVDLLAGLRGLDPKVYSRRVEVSFLGSVLRVVGREDFIAMKCFAGGPQDIADARSAYQDADGPVNLDLLRSVTRRFGRDAADRLEEILAP